MSSSSPSSSSPPPPQTPSNSRPFPPRGLTPVLDTPRITEMCQELFSHLADDRNFDIYIKHFELFRRGILLEYFFTTGVMETFPIINTPVLEELHKQFLEDDVILQNIFEKEDFLRVMEAIDMALSPHGFHMVLGAQRDFIDEVLSTRTFMQATGASVE